MSTLPEKPFLTPEEYLEIERKAELRSEYFQGKMSALPLSNRTHNLIAINLAQILGNQLLERDGNVYLCNMRVKIEKIDKYVYPDVVVTCGKENVEDDHDDTLLNPKVIIEILSNFTEAYDRGEKFRHYRLIESLAGYVLVSPDAVRLEKYTRQSTNRWRYDEYHNIADVVKLESVGCELALKNVYLKVFKNRTLD